MLDKELEQTLNQAFRDARNNNHEFMTVEHLLLALLDNNVSKEILLACGADIPALKAELDTFLQETVPLLPPNDERDTQPTLGFQRVSFQRSLMR
jgi:ATP-dependent Clp protease ATP-binding subunit ClpA